MLQCKKSLGAQHNERPGDPRPVSVLLGGNWHSLAAFCLLHVLSHRHGTSIMPPCHGSITLGSIVSLGCVRIGSKLPLLSFSFVRLWFSGRIVDGR